MRHPDESGVKGQGTTLSVERARDQSIVVLGSLCQRQLLEEAAEVEVGLAAVGLGGLDEAVEGGAGSRAARAAGEQQFLRPVSAGF